MPFTLNVDRWTPCRSLVPAPRREAGFSPRLLWPSTHRRGARHRAGLCRGLAWRDRGWLVVLTADEELARALGGQRLKLNAVTGIQERFWGGSH
jgi:hypothetical protein